MVDRIWERHTHTLSRPNSLWSTTWVRFSGGCRLHSRLLCFLADTYRETKRRLQVAFSTSGVGTALGKVSGGKEAVPPGFITSQM